MKKFLSVCVLAATMMVSTAYAQAVDTGILDWTANTEADLAGYKVYQRTSTGTYTTPVATLGKVITHTVTLPARTTSPQTFFWAVTAYDLAGNESPRSLEVTKTIPAVDLPPSAPVGVTVR